VRADRVLGDEQALGDLVGAEMVVEEEQDLDLAGGERACDRIGDAGAAAVPGPDLVEQTTRNRAGEGGLAVGDAVEEGGDLLGRLGLQEVAGRAGANRLQEVLLGAGGRQDDDLALGGSLAQPGQRGQAVEPGHGKVEQHEVRLEPRRVHDRLSAVGGAADDVEAVGAEERRERLAGQRVVVDDEDPGSQLLPLIGSNPSADKREVGKDGRTMNQSWLWGEILLAGLLGATLALFLVYPNLRTHYDLPELRLVLQTTMALAGLLVAVLAAARYSVEGRRVDLLLATGFFVPSLSSAVFAIGPRFNGRELHAAEAWSALIGAILGQALIAIAPFSRGRSKYREWSIANAVAAAGIMLFVAWSLLRALGAALPDLSPLNGQPQPFYLTGTLALQAFVCLVSVVGWGLRYARRGDDLARWLALGFTLMLFAALHLVFQPLLASSYVSQSDFLRMLAFIVILVGAWRAIQFAEFGRAVAEERARVARDIHDGLAQYLFAVSTHASMLEQGAPLAETIPRLKQAALLAQQEARFAILALSSASGTAPFDAALRRYVDVLTADGGLEVELEVDGAIRLAPDEQIEIFRIVQEGLANVRKHANATRAEVTIGQRPFGERFVNITDDGDGFDGAEDAAGQGLKNMRARAESIEGGFTLRSTPGRGTALEVVLRT
jgi:signal transduction histidine kinase